jgi:hypothetical protein
MLLHAKLLEQANTRLDELRVNLERFEKEMVRLSRSLQEGISAGETLSQYNRRYTRTMALFTVTIMVAIVGLGRSEWWPGDRVGKLFSSIAHRLRPAANPADPAGQVDSASTDPFSVSSEEGPERAPASQAAVDASSSTDAARFGSVREFIPFWLQKGNSRLLVMPGATSLTEPPGVALESTPPPSHAISSAAPENLSDAPEADASLESQETPSASPEDGGAELDNGSAYQELSRVSPESWLPVLGVAPAPEAPKIPTRPGTVDREPITLWRQPQSDRSRR